MWWAPFTLKSHYAIYQDSWRERCSRALGPQDTLKGLYIAATIDRRSYRRLYKYVNRCYLIGFCGYTSVPQRKQSWENYQENRSLHSKWVWEIEMFPGLTAGQGGGTLHTYEGMLLCRGRDRGDASEPRKGSLLSPRRGDSPLSFHLFYNSAQIGSCWPLTLLVISLNCSRDTGPGGIALTFFAF